MGHARDWPCVGDPCTWAAAGDWMTCANLGKWTVLGMRLVDGHDEPQLVAISCCYGHLESVVQYQSTVWSPEPEWLPTQAFVDNYQTLTEPFDGNVWQMVAV